VHAAPSVSVGTQAVAWQNVPCAQSLFAEQLEPQTPLLHATRQSPALAQVAPVVPPHLPSLPHTPEPLPCWLVQLPLVQVVPAPHVASVVQVALHWPFTHAPERHASPLAQLPPRSAPQWPSAAHTPPRHSLLLVHEVPPGRPQRLSAGEQMPDRQSALAVHSPVFEPHLPSASHTPDRHDASLVQVVPLGVPQRPSAPHAPPRHWVSAVHAPSLGVPQRLSWLSQVPAAHTMAPMALVQTPRLCSASVGMG
jgi:hypothetical protein